MTSLSSVIERSLFDLLAIFTSAHDGSVLTGRVKE